MKRDGARSDNRGVAVDVAAACALAASSLEELADPQKAARMQAYMKSDMPFYGVQKPARSGLLRVLVAGFAPAIRDDYERLVLELWSLPHREEKYLALGVARHHTGFVVPESLPLYRRLIVEGAWWDLVDEVATQLVRKLVRDHPVTTWPEVERWIEDDDMWLRRSAIICQVGLRERADADRLFRFCLRQAAETDFFIRKAIGWALRDHARTDAAAVAAFVGSHRDQLSGLSYREATKHIGHVVP